MAASRCISWVVRFNAVRPVLSLPAWTIECDIFVDCTGNIEYIVEYRLEKLSLPGVMC